MIITANPFEDVIEHHLGWCKRRKQDEHRAAQAEALAAKWYDAFLLGYKTAVPLPFQLYLREATNEPSRPKTRVFLGLLLLRLVDTCPNLSDIYQGRSLPTPRALLDAVMAAREEYHVLVELRPHEISKKAVLLFAPYARRCAEALDLDYDGPHDALDLRDNYITDRRHDTKVLDLSDF